MRETLAWRNNGGDPPERGHVYAATPDVWVEELIDQPRLQRKTVSAIHMPRWASRLTLEVTDVRVQRVQEISWSDAIAEGMKDPRRAAIRIDPERGPIGAFKDLWDSINGPGSWASNPWVWAITFRRVERTNP